jgi:methionine-rich copper-binding protein CopC
MVRHYILAALVTLAATSAQAHSDLKASVPVNGAVVATAPSEVTRS